MRTRLRKRRATALAAALGCVLAASAADALQTQLAVEFDTGLVGTFATVDITENAGVLSFSIALDPSLGPGRDLHEFYFNLVGAFTGVAISSTDLPTTAYALTAGPSVAGGAGSSFDYGVNFGNGGGPPGNGSLTTATFSLMADQPLAIADLLETSTASGRTITVNLAAHVQGTSLISGATSETVGGVVPEPSTALMLGTGLLGLAMGERHSRARRQAASPPVRAPRDPACPGFS